MSRLDRFLISGVWPDLYSHFFQPALPKPTSDHCPIILDLRVESRGHMPIHFELMWLEEKGFADRLRSWWTEI